MTKSTNQTETKREARLAELLGRLRDGLDVQLRDMRKVLTKVQFAAYQSAWQGEMAFRESLKDKPEMIVDYEARLKAAQFVYNRAESYNGSTNRKAARDKAGVKTNTRLYRQAETLCEQLDEYLRECYQRDPGTCNAWFDRSVDLGVGGSFGSTPAQFPRVITSRSLERQSAGMLQGQRTKREHKIEVFEGALQELAEEKLAAQRAALGLGDEVGDAGLAAAAELRAYLKRRR